MIFIDFCIREKIYTVIIGSGIFFESLTELCYGCDGSICSSECAYGNGYGTPFFKLDLKEYNIFKSIKELTNDMVTSKLISPLRL